VKLTTDATTNGDCPFTAELNLDWKLTVPLPGLLAVARPIWIDTVAPYRKVLGAPVYRITTWLLGNWSVATKSEGLTVPPPLMLNVPSEFRAPIPWLTVNVKVSPVWKVAGKVGLASVNPSRALVEAPAGKMFGCI
jgi:hypothetical protein